MNRSLRVVILALGSRGDVQPLANLGAGLRRAGHRVQLVTFEAFRPVAESAGIGFLPLRGDVRQMVLSLGEEGGFRERNPLRLWQVILRSFGRLRQTLPQDLDAMDWTTVDLLINQLPGCLYGFDLAERYGVRPVRAATIPLARTSSFPMLAFPRGLRRVPGYNAWTYRVAERIVWSGFGRSIDRWRKDSLGLRPSGGSGHFDRMETARVPILCGISPRVLARPADWGDHIHMTGYWYPSEEPPVLDGLKRFVEGGPPPVFLGFGSMPIANPERTTRMIVEAVRRSGGRAVLQAGWAGLGAGALPANIHLVGEVPYGWLFPRMSAVVHHGGSGTTAFGLRAGVPEWVIPFLFDQFYWGARVFELGVGPAAMPFRKLDADRLARGIETATRDKEMALRARSLADELSQEDSIRAAISALEA